jgi:hypothetical protein
MSDEKVQMLEVKILNLQTELRQAQEEAGFHRLRAEIALNAKAAGLNISAVDDVAARLVSGGAEWKVHKGKLVRHAGGTVPDVLDDGRPADVPNALRALKSSAPYFYGDEGAPSGSAAAPVRASTSATVSAQPGREPNRTLLGEKYKRSPEEAKQYLRQFGYDEARIAKSLGEPEPPAAWAR